MVCGGCRPEGSVLLAAMVVGLDPRMVDVVLKMKRVVDTSA